MMERVLVEIIAWGLVLAPLLMEITLLYIAFKYNSGLAAGAAFVFSLYYIMCGVEEAS